MITFLETEAQARWFAAHRSAGDRALAATPWAAYVCQQLGQPYLKMEEHARIGERAGQHGPILKRYLEWEGWLDRWAQEQVPEFAVAGFEPARACTYHLQILASEIWISATNVSELLAALRPRAVRSWPSRITHVPVMLQAQVSPPVALLPAIALRHGIDWVDGSLEAPELTPVTPPLAPLSTTWRDRLWRGLFQSRLRAELGMLRRCGARAYLAQLLPGAPRVLVCGIGYDLYPLTHALGRRGARIVRLPDESLATRAGDLPPAIAGRLGTAGARLREDSRMWELMEEWGVGHPALWGEALPAWWSALVPDLWLSFEQARRAVRSRAIAAFVTWDTGGSSRGSAGAQAAAGAGITRFVYQHGSSAGLDARGWQYLRHSDVLLAYGPGGAAELAQSTPTWLQPMPGVVPVGSSRLDELRRRHDPARSARLRRRLQCGDPRPIVLYVPTVFSSFARALSELAPYPEVSYLELLQRVLRLWNEVPGVRLLYKDLVVADDACRVMPEFIRSSIPSAIVSRQRLTDIMWAVDAIVVDHAITALNELLLTPKPLVVYMPPRQGPRSAAWTLLRRRAQVAEHPDEFVALVRDLLQRREFADETEADQSFLGAYGCDRNDGRSAERAAAAILGERVART